MRVQIRWRLILFKLALLVVLGMLVGSLVIVFDGVYSLVSLLLTLLSLAVSRYISNPQRSQFPFGKAILEPAVIAIKGLVILVIVGYSLYSAIVANISRDVLMYYSPSGT